VGTRSGAPRPRQAARETPRRLHRARRAGSASRAGKGRRRAIRGRHSAIRRPRSATQGRYSATRRRLACPLPAIVAGDRAVSVVAEGRAVSVAVADRAASVAAAVALIVSAAVEVPTVAAVTWAEDNYHPSSIPGIYRHADRAGILGRTLRSARDRSGLRDRDSDAGGQKSRQREARFITMVLSIAQR
jgi:hypothetical protein